MDSKFFSREAKTQRRLERLQKIAGGFATSHMLPGNGERALDRRELPAQAIAMVSDFLGQFIWPMPPQLTYRGMRIATRDENTPAIEADAQAIIGAKIITNSGCRKEVEIPVFIRGNQLLEPAVMIVDGIPRIIAQSLVDEIIKPRTFKQNIDPRGGMFGPPMNQEARDWYLSMPQELKTQDRYNQGMFAVAEKTAQADDDEYVPDAPIEIAYYIPGKGSWKRKTFKNQQKAEAWVDKLIEREGSDVEVRWERTSSKQAQAAPKVGDTIRLLDDPAPYIVSKNSNQPRYFYYTKGQEVTITGIDNKGHPLFKDEDGIEIALIPEEGGFEIVQGGLPGMAMKADMAKNVECPGCGWRMAEMQWDHETEYCPRCGAELDADEFVPDGVDLDASRCAQVNCSKCSRPYTVENPESSCWCCGRGDMCAECKAEHLKQNESCREYEAEYGPESMTDEELYGKESRLAQKYESGTRVKVSGEPARVIEQIHEPTGNNAFDGTYRVEFLNGKTDVVPESKLSRDSDQETERHVEGNRQVRCTWCKIQAQTRPIPMSGQPLCRICFDLFEGDGEFDRQAAREGDGQPAEHNESRKEDDFAPGGEVTFSQDYRQRTRGGPSYLIDKGTGATVVRDVFEDGTSFEVRLENGTKVVVPGDTLKSASSKLHADKPKVDQVLRDVEAMKNEGYSDLDIVLAVRHKYPNIGEAAINAAKERNLLDV